MKNIYIALIALLGLSAASCQKGFLEKRPDKSLLVPQTITDFQTIMDDFKRMNAAPGIHIIASDDRFVLDNAFAALNDKEQNAYIWAKDINATLDWTALYKQVFNANIVLEGLDKIIPPGDRIADYNNVKGSALFFRAYAFYQLADVFALTYDQATAATTPGILLRLKSDVNDRPSRSTLAQTFKQITEDLILASSLLPATSTLKTRPNAPAAMGLLARVYLAMESYDLAYEQANKSLMAYNKLLNYNTLAISNTGNPFPVALPNGNDEILLSTGQVNYAEITTSVIGYIDPLLFPSYHTNDLRKVMYYRDRGNGAATFKASYNGTVPVNCCRLWKFQRYSC